MLYSIKKQELDKLLINIKDLTKVAIEASSEIKALELENKRLLEERKELMQKNEELLYRLLKLEK